MSTGSWVRERRFNGPRLLPRRLRSLHTVVLVLVVAMVAWAGWLWYRSSSFVKVEHVTVTGLSGPDVPQIREALTSTALGMTTLHMQISKLESAVEQYTFVKAIEVTRRGAHGVSIQIDEHVPVALIKVGGDEQVVDANGQLLPSSTMTHGPLPVVPIKAAPTGATVTAAGARAAIAVLGAAPYALLAHVLSATSSSAHGVVVQLRNGPQLYFGTKLELQRKWNAAVAVLADHGSAGAGYVDVSDPERPAAGADVSAKQAAALGLVATTTTDSGSSGQ